MKKEQVNEVRDFLDKQKALGLNMLVITFMGGAMQRLDRMSGEEVAKIALEVIIKKTVVGIDPYEIILRRFFPDEQFRKEKAHAWIYVSWARAFPDKLAELNLPYEREYEAAKTLYAAFKGDVDFHTKDFSKN